MQLARRLGIFDAIMIVMGGIIGSGIFMNPYVVAQRLHTSGWILFVWAFGGMVALAGSFIYAELAARRPNVGGQYAYLREGVHPLVAFSYGWALLIVIQSGGMAAVALTFSRYFLELANTGLPDWLIAVPTLATLTIINCVGVRAGSTTQSILMVLKIGAIGMLVVCGLAFAPKSMTPVQTESLTSSGFLSLLGAGMIPVLFAYGGWQTSGFIAGEMKNPKRDLPIGLLVGVAGVIVLYLAVNYVCVSVLGPAGLANTPAPASAVMRAALGNAGGKIIAIGIAISTLGFLSQSMLTAPRVYFAMAEDRVFFRKVAYIHPVSRVPMIAIILQGLLAIIIALSGKYEQILNYVVAADFLFFGLTGAALFTLRKVDGEQSISFHVPGHPFTTIFFIAVSWLVVLNTFFKYPKDSLIGLALIILGLPVYYWWRKHERS
jgi:APA family basic amino acid/polyamine antiporter